MGLLDKFRRHQTMNDIRANGLGEGSNGKYCEYCSYRVHNPKTSFLICALTQSHVGASQVCASFERGDPRYVIR